VLQLGKIGAENLMHDVLDYRRYATECLCLAESETQQSLKIALTAVARTWLILANKIERLDVLMHGETVASRGTAASKVQKSYLPCSELLTHRELEVLDQISTGASSKEAARELGISFRTVEVHRSHMMAKLGAKNAVDLVRIVLGGGSA
jgi:DNA-binding NarL/FixJ family response regulator